jgi:hypothetical protein
MAFRIRKTSAYATLLNRFREAANFFSSNNFLSKLCVTKTGEKCRKISYCEDKNCLIFLRIEKILLSGRVFVMSVISLQHCCSMPNKVLNSICFWIYLGILNLSGLL